MRKNQQSLRRNTLPSPAADYATAAIKGLWPGGRIPVGLDFSDCWLFGTHRGQQVAVVIFAGQYFPRLASDHPLITKSFFGLEASVSARSLIAAGIIAAFAVLHICSLSTGKKVQGTLAVLLVGFILVFLGCGFSSEHGNPTFMHH